MEGRLLLRKALVAGDVVKLRRIAPEVVQLEPRSPPAGKLEVGFNPGVVSAMEQPLLGRRGVDVVGEGSRKSWPRSVGEVDRGGRTILLARRPAIRREVENVQEVRRANRAGGMRIDVALHAGQHEAAPWVNPAGLLGAQQREQASARHDFGNGDAGRFQNRRRKIRQADEVGDPAFACGASWPMDEKRHTNAEIVQRRFAAGNGIPLSPATITRVSSSAPCSASSSSIPRVV